MSVEVYQHFISGAWVDSTSGETMPTYCPGDGELIGHLQLGNAEDGHRRRGRGRCGHGQPSRTIRASPAAIS